MNLVWFCISQVIEVVKVFSKEGQRRGPEIFRYIFHFPDGF